jgi:hypothetical protein
MSDIGLRLDVIHSFFDKEKVVKALNRAEREALSKFGSFVWKRSRTSIVKRKRISRPGSPPSGHGRQLLRKNIFFAYEPEKHSVVIGPARLGGEGREILRRIELGGVARGRVNHRTRATVAMTYRPRPFMGPALKAEATNFPNLWANTVKE